MMVCSTCGAYIVPTIDKVRQSITCPECMSQESVHILPLFIVTGASGVGKTTVVSALRTQMPAFDVFETDILWDTDWQKQRNSWLRVAYSIAQSGRGTILCGTMMPDEIKRCDHYELFNPVYFLNLHCDDATRERRLRARPEWRQSGSDAFIEQHRTFAQWLVDNAETAFDPAMHTVDTTDAPVEEVARQIKTWVFKRWPANEAKSM